MTSFRARFRNAVDNAWEDSNIYRASEKARRQGRIGAELSLVAFGVLITTFHLVSRGVFGHDASMIADAKQFVSSLLTLPWALTFTTLGYVSCYSATLLAYSIPFLAQLVSYTPYILRTPQKKA